MKGSCVVPCRVFDGGTGVAHVFWGLLTLLGRQAQVKADGRQEHGAEMRTGNSDSPTYPRNLNNQ